MDIGRDSPEVGNRVAINHKLLGFFVHKMDGICNKYDKEILYINTRIEIYRNIHKRNHYN